MRASSTWRGRVDTGVALLSLAGLAGAQTELFQLPGTADNEGLGYSVDFVGDVNGDNVSDLISGAPNHPPGTGGGKAYLFSGADRTLLLSWLPSASGSYFGMIVAAAGDVDLNGIPDVLVSAPWADSGDFHGRVFLFSGLDGSTIYQFVGEQSNSILGRGLAALGDVDSDTWPDFAIGAPGQGAVRGKLYVHSGRDGGLHWVASGSQSEWDYFGSAVAGLGDIDGDQLSDVIVGAPYLGPNNTGAVYVYSGASGTLLFQDTSGPGTLIGSSVAGPGDMDGDGVRDWAYGVPGGGGAFPSVRLRSGADGSLIHEWFGTGSFSRFGDSVIPAGDVNHDGVPDLWITQPTASVAPEKIWFVDGATRELALGIEDQHTQTLAIAAGGDLSGDGVPDLLVGRPLQGSSIGDGEVRGFSIGCSTDPVGNYCTSSPNSAGSGAVMGSTGSSSVSANDLRLEASGCPPGQNGIFFYGASEAALPFGDGVRCIASPIYRLNPPVGTGSGTATRLLDLEALPPSAAPILAGSRWRFQFWYRDPGFGSFGFNLSDGLAVEFCP